MEFDIKRVEVFLLISAVVAMLTRKLRIPYSIGLVAAGIAIALLPVGLNVSLTKEMIFDILLPPLIFEAAFFLPWHELRKELPVILSIATLGFIFAASVTAVGMHYLVHWPWISACIFGSLIAATDPVSVIATFKEAGVKGRLRILVEAESLFNDGVAAVAFSLFMVLAAGASVTVLDIGARLLTTVGAGLGCGLVVAVAALAFLKKTDEHLVEITLTTVAAYGSFLLAESIHGSGVLATLVAGLVIGNTGSLGSVTDRGREAVIAFWEYIAFAVNSLVFLLIGVHEAQQNFMYSLVPASVAVVLVLIGRAAAVYPTCVFFSRGNLSVSYKHQHILFWGGLRGALALALALGLPVDMPYRDEIVTVSFGVVAFSIFIQGITVTPLLRYLKELPASAK